MSSWFNEFIYKFNMIESKTNKLLGEITLEKSIYYDQQEDQEKGTNRHIVSVEFSKWSKRNQRRKS